LDHQPDKTFLAEARANAADLGNNLQRTFHLVRLILTRLTMTWKSAAIGVSDLATFRPVPPFALSTALG
jgi:hypothetical protein